MPRCPRLEQLATDIMVSKYFRKAGVPQTDPQTGKPLIDDDGRSHDRAGAQRGRSFIASRGAGATGARRTATSTPADAQAFYDELCYMMVHQMARPTARSGSTRGCTGRTASMVRRRGTGYADPKTGECGWRRMRTRIRSRTRASFSRWMTISSTRAGSWICGCARRGCSSTARARDELLALRAENEPLSGGGAAAG
jgi:ribonucleoside-diphosphate reductase alpha chain